MVTKDVRDFGLVLTALLGLAPGLSAIASERFSTLSDGKFETQLERPETTSLVPGSAEMQTALKYFDELPFDVGERMQYLITYLGIRGGSAEAVIHHPVKSKDGWSMRVTGEVKSAEWYSWITRVHDAVEAVLSPAQDYRPLQFFMNQQESKYFNTKLVQFDWTAGKVQQKERRKDKEAKSETFELVPNTKDGVGALYYLRQEIDKHPKDATFEFPIFTSDKTWTGKVKFLRSEKRKVLGQEFETDVYALDTQFGGLLQQEGDVRVWFTQDKRRLPVYIQANVAFGYIEVELVEWEQGFANPAKKTIFPKIERKKD
jgi:hypothetical protein